jgi:hypothetical protein
VSSKTAKRRGRPIVVDGTRYYWGVSAYKLDGTLVREVHVLLPTGRRLCVPYYEIVNDTAPPHGGLEITPSAVAAFIRRTIVDAEKGEAEP